MRGYPERWIVYDCETRATTVLGCPGTRELTLRLGCAACHSTAPAQRGAPLWCEFTASDQFHEFVHSLAKSDKPLWIFAHNHGFDARIVGFFRELALGTYSLYPPHDPSRRARALNPLFIIDGSPFLLRLYRRDGQCLLLADTMNWLDCSLAKIGEMLGNPKGTMPHPDDDDHTWMSYCRRDVEVTSLALRAIFGFCRTIGVKDWQATIASQAQIHFRSYYPPRRIEMPKDISQLDLDRLAYYGGRTDCFRIGRIEGPIHQVDVNAMYPSLMKDCLFPVKIEECCHDAKAKTKGPPPHPGQTTAEVWLDSPDRAYPVRCRDGTYYVRGRVRTVLCGPELRRACESQHVTFHGRWTRYRLSRIFAQWVHDLWALRLDARGRGERLSDRLAKVMMNALFGKFGQKQGSWVTLGDDYPPSDYGGGISCGVDREHDIDWRVIAGTYQRRLRGQLAPHAFVPIAAYTTSYGRVFMDAVRSKLWEGGLYYQATDSLLVDSGNLELMQAAGLMGEDQLGKFRREETWPWIEIRNALHIERPSRPIRGGLPASAVLHAADVYEWGRWDAPWTGICGGNVSCVSITQALTRLRGRYNRQEILGSGQCQPWAISNWLLTPEEQRKAPFSRDRNER